MTNAMRMTSLAALLTGLLLCSCGGSSTQTTAAPEQFNAPEQTAGMPVLPTESLPRTGAVVTGTVFDGDSCVAFNNGTLDSGVAWLESDPAPGTIGWALYQIAEPIDPPHALTVHATFVDQDPHSATERDGYWVAYGNFDSESWVFNGPFTESQTRVFFDPAMDVVSPGGDITALVLCENGNQVNVESIQVGTDAGPGYEETILSLPAGAFIGEWADIETDAAGNPHVIYNVSPIMMYHSHEMSTLRYAHHDGTAWHVEDFDTPGVQYVRWARLALGDGGRRAVLVKDRGATNDLFLYYDDGGGSFADAGSVAVDPVNQCFSGLTFINSGDNPAGERDLLMMTYAIHTASPDTQTYYRTYDGAVLSPQQNLYGLETRECGRLALATGPALNAVAGVPQEAGGDWRYYVGYYSAVADTWDFGSVVSWVTPEDVEDDHSYRPDFDLHVIPDGDVIASYLEEEEEYIRFARWNGADWLTTDEDLVPTYAGLSDYISESDVYSTGQIATAVPFGGTSPAVIKGFVGTGDAWFRTYLNLEPWTALQSAVAVDAMNNTHVTTVNFTAGTLDYYRIDAATHLVESTTIDNGAGTTGICTGFSWPVYVDGDLHLFYADETNHCIRYSANRNGVWLVENEQVSESALEVPYMVIGAGYLENLGLLYAAYVDMLTLNVRVVSGPPSGNDWQTYDFAQFYMPPAAVADNETELAVFGRSFLIESSAPMFACGHPRTGMHEREIVNLAVDQVDFPFFLTYNHFIGQWCAVTTDYGGHRVNYFLRAPLGNWVGPFVVESDLDPGADVEAAGININRNDGTVRITLSHSPDGVAETGIWVYSAPNGSAVFAPTQQLMVLDPAVNEFNYATTVGRGDGEPISAVLYTPVGDTTWDVRYFAPTGPGTWSSIGVWDTTMNGFYIGLTLDDSGRIISTGIELAGGDSLGRVTVRYPW